MQVYMHDECQRFDDNYLIIIIIADRNNQKNSRKSMLLTSTLLVIGLLLALIFIVAIMTLGLFVVYLKGMDNDFNNIIIVYMY